MKILIQDSCFTKFVKLHGMEFEKKVNHIYAKKILIQDLIHDVEDENLLDDIIKKLSTVLTCSLYEANDCEQCNNKCEYSEYDL